MDFSLIPAGSLKVSIRERGDRLLEKRIEPHPPSWTQADPSVLYKIYKPAWNTFFIDYENIQRLESVNQLGEVPAWKNIPPRTAKTYYQKSAADQQTPKHFVDLYI